MSFTSEGSSVARRHGARCATSPRSSRTAEARGRSGKLALAVALLALVAVGCGGTESEEPVVQGASQAASLAGVGSLRLSTGTVTAGGSVTGTVTLSRSVRSSSGGAIVYVGFPNALLAGPRFIRIPNGASSGTFTLYSNPYLTASTVTSISTTTATPQPASFLTQTLSIVPSASPPATALPHVTSLTLSAAAVASGSPVIGTVTLSGPAPAGGAVVQLSNSNDFFNLDADLPPVAFIPSGVTSASFTVRTHVSSSAASSVQEIIVGNYFGGVFQGAYLTIE
jgi:hypothetical protein